MIRIEIDSYSGFCFGVKKAIAAADELLQSGEKVFCVGDIVHNEAEANRLRQRGMQIISYDDVEGIAEGTVLFRAHGEPPSTYRRVQKAGLPLKDETCPVVLKLQERIRKACEAMKGLDGQVVIFGKRGHAEVLGLEGQCEGRAIVIEGEEEIDLLDLSRPVVLFAQTTKDPEHLKRIVAVIEQRSGQRIDWHNTTCKQVTGRVPRLRDFAQKHEVIVFVGGRKSSNARVLYASCLDVNTQSYFVSEPSDLQAEWFKTVNQSVGVCGATSTPQWLMESVAGAIRAFLA